MQLLNQPRDISKSHPRDETPEDKPKTSSSTYAVYSDQEELIDKAKDDDTSWTRSVDDLLTYFPLAYKEQKRLQMVNSVSLFQVSIPVPQLQEIVDDNKPELKKLYPNAMALFCTAFGNKCYRTLLAKTFDKELGHEFLKAASKKSAFAEYGCRNLSACQYVVQEGVTLQFNQSEGLPKFVELFNQDPVHFEEAMKGTDPLYENYVKDAKRRGVWNALTKKLTNGKGSAENVKINAEKLVNMFEVYVAFGLDYIGVPIKLRGLCVGVLCMLYRRPESPQPLSQEAVKKMEEIAKQMGDYFESLKYADQDSPVTFTKTNSEERNLLDQLEEKNLEIAKLREQVRDMQMVKQKTTVIDESLNLAHASLDSEEVGSHTGCGTKCILQ